MKQVSASRAFEGVQYVYSHPSNACRCDMTFAIYLPPQAERGKVPLLWFLSGLTCTHQNVMDKGEYRRAASALGVGVICPDTSPRGDDVPDEKDNWQFGKGAGFYLDATEAPYATNYNMATYVIEELPALVGNAFPVDMARQGIFGHSMGGHGALTLALKNPGRFRSVSAFAPIVHPSTADWSRPAFGKYLGPDESAWRQYDAVDLIKDGARVKEILVDQGSADPFLENGLQPWLLTEACEKADIPLTLTMREGYDHSYNFISTFMGDHIAWHAARLKA
ncbi:MAG: S-formylglutathione hydrolase [Rhizobiales bacterium]|nr:S-formylglutathione hydrolase [Hyphomicrobiales bacterium]